MDVAAIGFDAMMDGEGDVVSGWHSKLQSAIANINKRRGLGHRSPLGSSA